MILAEALLTATTPMYCFEFGFFCSPIAAPQYLEINRKTHSRCQSACSRRKARCKDTKPEMNV
eukprot:1140510-Rhodomonas_salina.1